MLQLPGVMQDLMSSSGFKLVSELSIVGGDERKVGYYAGVLVLLYPFSQLARTERYHRCLYISPPRRPPFFNGVAFRTALGASPSSYAVF